MLYCEQKTKIYYSAKFISYQAFVLEILLNI